MSRRQGSLTCNSTYNCFTEEDDSDNNSNNKIIIIIMTMTTITATTENIIMAAVDQAISTDCFLFYEHLSLF